MSGNPVSLGGNINALILWNLGGENVTLSEDNSVKLDAALRQGTTTTQPAQPTQALQPAPAAVGGS